MKKLKTRAKGYRNENELVKRLRAMKISCRRIPMSGQASHTGDIIIFSDHRNIIAEVKAYKQNFFEYELMGHSDLVFKRTTSSKDSKDWLVTMPIKYYMELVKK